MALISYTTRVMGRHILNVTYAHDIRSNQELITKSL
jgi:hypothetical protein